MIKMYTNEHCQRQCWEKWKRDMNKLRIGNVGFNADQVIKSLSLSLSFFFLTLSVHGTLACNARACFIKCRFCCLSFECRKEGMLIKKETPKLNFTGRKLKVSRGKMYYSCSVFLLVSTPAFFWFFDDTQTLIRGSIRIMFFMLA